MDWVNGDHVEDSELAERLYNSVREIAARCRRANRDNDFSAGRKVAYIDSLAVIFGTTHQEIRQAIKEGVL